MHSPPYNRRLRNPERYAYIGVDYRHPFPVLVITAEPWPGGRFLGPFPSRKRVDEAVGVIADAFGLRTCDPLPDGQACWRHQVRLCSAPCVGQTTAGRYGRALLRALLALAGRSRTALSTLIAERDRLAAAERFEEAARRQRSIEAIRRVSRLLYVTERRTDDVVVVQPGPELGAVALWSIVDGAVSNRVEAPRDVLAGSFSALWERASKRARTRAPLVPQEELDARWVVSRWLASHDGRRWSVPFRGRTASEVWSRVSKLADAATADLFR